MSVAQKTTGQKMMALRLGMITAGNKYKLRGTMDDSDVGDGMIVYKHDDSIKENEVTWFGKVYTRADTYYQQVVMTMPRKDDDTVVGADEHLGAICVLKGHGVLIMEDTGTIHVGRWRVNDDYITHKHPEFGRIEDWWQDGYVQAELGDDDTCGLCGDQVSGEIKMIHDFYRMG
jgi:hypothetical protein